MHVLRHAEPAVQCGALHAERLAALWLPQCSADACQQLREASLRLQARRKSVCALYEHLAAVHQAWDVKLQGAGDRQLL